VNAKGRKAVRAGCSACADDNRHISKKAQVEVAAAYLTADGDLWESVLGQVGLISADPSIKKRIRTTVQSHTLLGDAGSGHLGATDGQMPTARRSQCRRADRHCCSRNGNTSRAAGKERERDHHLERDAGQALGAAGADRPARGCRPPAAQAHDVPGGRTDPRSQSSDRTPRWPIAPQWAYLRRPGPHPPAAEHPNHERDRP
jgi:hypothetical protein